MEVTVRAFSLSDFNDKYIYYLIIFYYIFMGKIVCTSLKIVFEGFSDKS
jgi:hypothetical protein